MKTSVMEVHDMLSVLSVEGVEKRIGKVAGVESVTVNFAAGNATVRYDETRLDIADIRSDVRQSSYEADDSTVAPPGDSHEGHATRSAPPAPMPAAPKAPPIAPEAAGVASEGTAQPTGTATPTTPEPSSVAAPTPTPTSAAPVGDEHQHKAALDKS